MVNLFIAVIITDANEMKQDASTQSLISMAQLSILGKININLTLLAKSIQYFVLLNKSYKYWSIRKKTGTGPSKD